MIDTDEKPRAAGVLQLSPESLLDGLRAIFWEMDAATLQFTFVSAAADTILGYPTSQWVEERDFWRAHLHADDRDRAVEYCAQCTAAGCDHEIEYRMIAADGRSVWLRDVVHVGAATADTARSLHGVMFDITRQKQLEVELRASEQRFERLSDANADGVAIHSEGRITDVNRRLASMLGYDPAELIGRTPLELTVPDERPKLMAHIAAGKETPIQGTALRRDGGTFPVEVRGQSITTADGTTARVVLVRDITERLAAERVVRDSEARLRLLMQQIPALLWTTDRNFRFTSVIGRGLAMHSTLQEKALLGVRMQDHLASRDDGPLVIDAHETALGGQSASYQRETGGVRWTAHVEPLRGADGTIEGIIGVAMDVSESHRLAAALTESEARYRALVESMPDGVAVHVDGKFAFVNEAGLRLLGARSRDEVLGRDVLDFVHPDSMDLARQQIDTLMHDAEHIVVGRYRLLRLDGSGVDIELSASALEYGGRRAIQVICRDISDRLKTEAALRSTELQLLHSQKLEAVGRLAGGVAHDFNNLLTVISAFTQMARANLPEGDSRAADLREVQSAAGRAAELTRQLLAFSRTQVLQAAVIDLHEVVREIEKMLQRMIGEAVRLETELIGESASIHADRSQVEQVLMNLVVNARDAMPGGGTVRITSAVVDIDESFAQLHLAPNATAGRYVRLEVTDSGVGMEPAIQPHVFEPFFTTKPVGRGTGLGLATVYGIVKQSNGYITLDSAPGSGTTIGVYFPSVNDEVAPADTATPTIATGSETILLVEDQHAVREAARRILTSRGYTVLTAQHAFEALEIARTHRGAIDLLLTDLVMPDVGGAELATQILAEQPDLPVLYMSGYSIGRDIGTLDDQPLRPLLEKPFTIESLVAAVRDAMSRRTRS